MNGAREYSRLFKTGQCGRFYIVSGSHARGKTFHIYVLPEGETAIPNGQHNGPLNKDTVEVYGITGGQPGWTEAYGWLKEGPWIEEFNDLLGSTTGIRPPSVEAKSRGIMTKCDGNHALTTLCTDRECWLGEENPMLRMYAQSAHFEVERKAYADAILIHLSGIIPTPESGYLKDGGVSLAKSDLARLRNLYIGHNRTIESLYNEYRIDMTELAASMGIKYESLKEDKFKQLLEIACRLKDSDSKYKEMMELQREHGDQWLNYLISTYITENDLLSDVCKDLTTVRDQQAERLKDSLFRLIDLQNENAALRQNAELAKRTRGFSVGDAVMVYDRYRFAIPLKATIQQFSDTNDGVRVMLLESNSAQYPIGADNVWVHQSQIRHAK